MAGSFSRSQIVAKPGVVSVAGGVVAAQHVLAAEAGAAVLAAGGDAVDAAVATSFAMGVLEPWMSGPMGGGAMMLWRAGEERAYALNYGMRASAFLDANHYPLSGAGKASDLFPWETVVEDRNIIGGSSVAVPGTVAGIAAAHGRFGRMPWAELLAPAIKYAKQGMQIDWYAALIIASAAKDLAKDPDAARMFLDEGQWPKTFGWTALSDVRLDQSGMAATLEHLALAGAADFYEGDIAAALVRDVSDKGGFLTADDLAGYQAEWSDPLIIPYRQGHIFAVPGLTAGPTLADAVSQWQSEYPASEAETPSAYVARAGAIRAAYERRLSEMGDHEAAKAPGCTTHFSVVDHDGNMVSMTQTLLSVFGSRTVSPSTGLLLNNGIMWFDPEPGKSNSLAAGKRCLMNVCPVVGRNGDRTFALGASGGRKIMPAVGQIAAQLLETPATLQQAIEAPRMDASGGPLVVADERLEGPVTEALSKNWQITTAKRLPFPLAFACPAAVLREGGLNSGTTETFSPWGDAVSEGAAE
ncbi:gamma-glutamyltransferase [Falsirhodobacter sp. alg1]|uniref:gamma-glutamyltransferase n=1 Tax=Falsirhodobacter sp. alg1 TaxID=1472418 RepID=UPI0005EF7CCD|nr:gamma-glutamyltransferase [Falsirhodobacter sp. alg1]